MRKQSEEAGAGGKVRLQRVLAAAGIAARRAAEEMIEEGRVEVNGRVVTQLPVFVDPEQDRITVDGRPLPKAQRPIYIMVNKPERMLTVSADEPGMDRATVLDLIDHPARPRLVPIGRLDWNTPGLVLLTNDGNAVNRLTHPRYGVSKLYRAVVRGGIDDAAARDLEQRIGKLIRKDDKLAGRVRPGAGRVRIDVETADADRSTILIRVQGRTGNLASMFAGAGVAVRKLERIAIGPVELRGLARGRWRELEREEIHALRSAVKGKRTEAAKPTPPKRKRQGPPRAGAPARRDRRRAEGERRGRPAANRAPNPRNHPGNKPRKRA